jgi:hypothetical protein
MGEGIGVISSEEAIAISAKPVLAQYEKSFDVYFVIPKKRKNLGVIKAIESIF